MGAAIDALGRACVREGRKIRRSQHADPMLGVYAVRCGAVRRLDHEMVGEASFESN
jgi:hypothetical protein